MNKTETLRLMAVLRIAYPRYYQNTTKADAEAVVNLWATMFADQPYELVEAAVKSCIATSKWPPSIAEINEELQRLSQPEEMTELEAWNLVAKALRNSGYESREEFKKLPKEIQQVLGSPTTLRDWAMLPMDQLQTVIASNFQRSYRARVESARKYKVLPTDVRERLGSGWLKSLPMVENDRQIPVLDVKAQR